METVKELKDRIRNWSEHAKIYFKESPKAIVYKTSRATTEKRFGEGKERGNQRFHLYSEATLNEERKVLELAPFDFCKRSGADEVWESMEPVIEYWVKYASIKGMEKITIPISTEGKSDGNGWPNGERVFIAVRLGFQVVASKRRGSYRDYELELNLSDYRKYEERVDRIDRSAKKMTAEDPAIYLQELSLFYASDVIGKCGDNVPFHAKKITAYGFEGYVCFREFEGNMVLELYTAEGWDKEAPLFVSVFAESEEDVALEKMMVYIKESQVLVNVIEVPTDMLQRQLRKYYSKNFAKKFAESLMEQLEQDGLNYVEVEREMGAMLDGNKGAKVEELFAGEHFYRYFQLLGRFLVVESLATAKAAGRNENTKALVFQNKEQLGGYLKEKLETKLWFKV